ncbi:MAG: ribonuclease III [bacterium]|nr:ribonuclease III [bacterium]
MTVDFFPFETKAGVTFKDKNLLRQAFTHRSYINEMRDFSVEHNERLEFLGDAVLELVVTDYLFHKYPKKPEGELTSYRSSLVNSQTLSSIAATLEMGEYLLLSRGEAKDKGRGRQYILANTFEAVIGALYLDQGYEAAREFLERHVLPLIDDIIAKGAFIDAKSRFQEKAQEIASVTPSYKTLREVGPDHSKKFTVGVFLGSELVAEGEGESKQEAEQNAARVGLQEKGWL